MVAKRALGMAAVCSTLLLAACNMPNPTTLLDAVQTAPTDPGAQTAPLVIDAVSTSSAELSTCSGNSIEVQAHLAPTDGTVADATLRYRLAAGDEASARAWIEIPMVPGVDDSGAYFTAQLPAPQQVGSGHNVEYLVELLDGAGRESWWPANETDVATLPLVPCDSVAAPGNPQAAPAFEVQDFSATPATVEYGGCAGGGVQFEIVISGYQQVESVYAKTTWITEQGPGSSSEHALADSGPAQGYPGAHRFAAGVDLTADANTNLDGQAGNVGWNTYVERAGEQTAGHPAGDPPLIGVTRCPGRDLAPLPTPTLPIIVIPLPTAAPLGLVNPGQIAYNQGQETMLEGQFFDLDEGQFANGGPFVPGDFHLDAGDDPYLDDIRPFSGSYFGWFGNQQPSNADCQNTLKSTDSQTIEWPDQQGTYYCYETDEGRPGWLRVGQWVSLPINERRFEFTWFTWQ